MKSSRVQGFHSLSPLQRAELGLGELSEDQVAQLSSGGITVSDASTLVENVVGVMGFPLALVPNFLINDLETFVPLATEEPSVVAACANGAKLAREGGGFMVTHSPRITTGQVVMECDDVIEAWHWIQEREDELLAGLKRLDPVLAELGGGPLFIERGPQVAEDTLSLLLHVESRDAMGANIVNTMSEHLLELLVKAGLGRRMGAIITNAMPRRTTSVTAKIPLSLLKKGEMSGADGARGIVSMSNWAAADPYRAVTHNKGIMNGVTGVTLATGNDTRAVEAAAHFYASRSGVYSPLSTWRIEGAFLQGDLTMPLPLGSVGGMTCLHPTVKLFMERLHIKSARTIASMAAAAGLANNLAALWAISTEGIQKGHMALHSRRNHD